MPAEWFHVPGGHTGEEVYACKPKYQCLMSYNGIPSYLHIKGQLDNLSLLENPEI